MNFIKTTVLSLVISFSSIYSVCSFSAATVTETSYEMFRRIQGSKPAAGQLIEARERFKDTARTDKDIFLLSIYGNDNEPKYLFATLVLANLPFGTSYESFYEDRDALIEILSEVLLGANGREMKGYFNSLTGDQFKALERVLSRPVVGGDISREAFKRAKLQGFFEAIIPFRG